VNALVIGGTGFIGLNLVEALEAGGHAVRAGRRPSSNTIFARRLKVPLVPVDLADPEGLASAMAGSDVVFFAAGHYPRYAGNTEAEVATGVAGIEAALAAARRAAVRRLVYVGSVATVARRADGQPATEAEGLATPPAGATYHAVKVAMARAVQAAADAGDLEVVTACPTGCLGPYDHKVGTGYLVAGVGSGRLDAYVDGFVDLVDARDVARSLVAAAEVGRPGARYILAGHGLPVGTLVSRLARRLGVPPPPRRLAPDAALAFADAEEARCRGTAERPRLSRELVDLILHGQLVDDALARAELGHVSRPLEATFDDTFDWYLRNGFVRRPERNAS
jgi:dihydroflavonol-4-reductase